GVLPVVDGSCPVGVDSALRVYRYRDAQRFKRHKDGVVMRDGMASRFSYLVYLNAGFEGGETRFTFPTFPLGKRVDETLSVCPEPGMALLFEHDLWHEGVPVTEGCKYVLRTDVLYSRG
ncbi:MAG: 2OG-Fe(II) oxygenase, partial [Planctomycetota bacterium]